MHAWQTWRMIKALRRTTNAGANEKYLNATAEMTYVTDVTECAIHIKVKALE